MILKIFSLIYEEYMQLYNKQYIKFILLYTVYHNITNKFWSTKEKIPFHLQKNILLIKKKKVLK